MKRLPNYFTVAFALIILIGSFLYFQATSVDSVGINATKIIPFDSKRWEITAKQSMVEDYLGSKSLVLKGGFAVVKDSEFTDGIIEYDVAFAKERGFMGAMWRLQDLKNYDKFYIRPHRSGEPDANHYTPVFNGVTGWQLYNPGKGYGAPSKYPFDQWIHIKIIVSGKNAEMYIQDMAQPALFINELKSELKPGKVGLIVENFAPAHFANFSYTSLTNPPLKGKPKEPENVPAGIIKSWLVSNIFDEKSLEGKFFLNKDDKQMLSWKKLNAERNGLTNLARVQGIGLGKNCVFARKTIISDREQVKRLKFGFSDSIKVYFNDNLIYSGHDEFMSRDYRFLGTVGFYDEVYLPLKKGENELWMAVAESILSDDPSGGTGWGMQAKFENMEGISVRD